MLNKMHRFGLDGATLKWIALITMTIDHTGAVLFPQYMVLRMIGRIAFPLYAFFIAEGYFHTKNVKNYLLRLTLLAFISEIPFDLALFGSIFEPQHQNVFFTLAIGLLAIWIIDTLFQQDKWFLAIVAAAFFCGFAQLLHTDYGGFGIGIILLFYLSKRLGYFGYGAGGILLYVIMRYSPVRLYTLLAIPIIYFYNGNRGKQIKWLLYFYYPIHLTILAIIAICSSRF